MPEPVDIVIPVYKGEAETRRCVESVLRARHDTPIEVIVIDDASPEPALSRWLAELEAAGSVTRIAHRENQGFVASVNAGMACHPARDVVLLNSDTEVADGWIDRLCAHARGDARIGTVTPLSNNATICSYPRPLQSNALRAGDTVASLDHAFATANAATSVDIPTAVGFCMLVTRRCLDAVGSFDRQRYGRGYGEEVDFCMRAARAGFRNVAAADVFVRHVGEVSFGDAGADRRASAQALVDDLYPEFQPGLAAFLAADPLLAARRRADLTRLMRSQRPRLLLVTHAFGGGVRRHVEWLARHAAAGCEVLVLQPGETSPVTRSVYALLRWANEGEAFRAWFRQADEWPRLVEMLRTIGIARVHLHHVHGLPPEVLELPQALGCGHDVTFHDYYAICPQYHLVGGDGRYCGEPAGDCRRCEEMGAAQWPVSIPEWRAAFRRFCAGARCAIAPSRDCAARVARYFPEVSPVLAPHPDGGALPASPVIRVIVAGALSPEKGLDLLEACAREAHANARPLHFIVAGFLARAIASWPALPLEVMGEYPEGALPQRLATLDGDVLFFPAQCPETFSYTLGDAIASGVPIVATDLGALPERLAAVANATVLPWNAQARMFNEALVAAAHKAQPAGAHTPAAGDFYAARYLSGLPAPQQRSHALPGLDARWWRDPREPLARATLVQLYDDGVRCGRSDSLAELRTRIAAADDQALDMERRLAHAQAEAAAADERAAAAERRAAALEASTAWRLSGPLRRFLTALRGRRR